MANSIRFWHHSCYNAFITLGQALDQNTADKADFSQEDFIDLFGRFKVWADNIGAGQQGRASLDYRLREASNYRDVVTQNLRYLLKALNDGTSSVKLAGFSAQHLLQLARVTLLGCSLMFNPARCHFLLPPLILRMLSNINRVGRKTACG